VVEAARRLLLVAADPQRRCGGGTYQVNTGVCNLASCCCPSGTISLAQTGTTVSGTMSLAGQCGGSTTLPFFCNLAIATSTTSNLQWITGQPLIVVKNGVTVTMTNGDASQCSSSATCTSGDCLQSGASTTCFYESTLINYKGVVRTQPLERNDFSNVV
jgi:hypothetical protein